MWSSDLIRETELNSLNEPLGVAVNSHARVGVTTNIGLFRSRATLLEPGMGFFAEFLCVMILQLEARRTGEHGGRKSVEHFQSTFYF